MFSFEQHVWPRVVEEIEAPLKSQILKLENMVLAKEVQVAALQASLASTQGNLAAHVNEIGRLRRALDSLGWLDAMDEPYRRVYPEG